MAQPSDVAEFLAAVRERGPAFEISEAKQHRLASGAREVVTIREEGAIVAIGVAAPHRQSDGRAHWSVETTVRPDLAFPEFEGMVLERSIALVPRGEPMSVWSTRSTLTAALGDRGFVPTRSILHMTVSLPLPVSPEPTDAIRPMEPDDIDAILTVNRRAFAGHREAEQLDRDGFEALTREDWFDASGLLVALVEGRVVGFCWTKVHPDGEGEIYRIAVDPSDHGLGFGRRLVAAGFDLLAARADVTHGGLWVEGTNTAGVRLYESLGMESDRTITEFERPQPKR